MIFDLHLFSARALKKKKRDAASDSNNPKILGELVAFVPPSIDSC